MTLVPAYTALIIAYVDAGQIYGRPFDEATRLAAVWARRALDIDANDADIHTAMALTAQVVGHRDEAYKRVSLALALNTNSYWANAIQGALLLFDRRLTEGRSFLLKALRLNPRDPRGAVRWNQIVICTITNAITKEQLRLHSARLLGIPIFRCRIAGLRRL